MGCLVHEGLMAYERETDQIWQAWAALSSVCIFVWAVDLAPCFEN
jgi:hypothetical protein